jgi:hypothetical protein
MLAMSVRRAFVVCATLALTIGSLGACALFVGDPDGHRQFESIDLNDGASAVCTPDSTVPEAGPADSSLPDSDSAITDAPVAEAEADVSGLGPNLIGNGDFSEAGALWSVVAGGGSIADAGNGVLCVWAPASQLTTLGWGPPGVALFSANTYQFSYIAMATQQPVIVDAKVGHSSAPFGADFDSPNDGVITSWQPFVHTFSPPGNDSSAGLSFAITSPVSQDVCFQNVILATR